MRAVSALIMSRPPAVPRPGDRAQTTRYAASAGYAAPASVHRRCVGSASPGVYGPPSAPRVARRFEPVPFAASERGGTAAGRIAAGDPALSEQHDSLVEDGCHGKDFPSSHAARSGCGLSAAPRRARSTVAQRGLVEAGAEQNAQGEVLATRLRQRRLQRRARLPAVPLRSLWRPSPSPH